MKKHATATIMTTEQNLIEVLVILITGSKFTLLLKQYNLLHSSFPVKCETILAFYFQIINSISINAL